MMESGAKNTFNCIKKFDVPTLIVHGDDDQIVPISAATLRSSKLVKNATLKIYTGAPTVSCTHTKTTQCGPAGIP